MVEVFKVFTFEAAHYLPLVPERHKCGRMHGHSYQVTVRVEGELDEMGMVVDYDRIAAVFGARVYGVLDHKVLNEVPGLENPTSEHLAMWIASQLGPLAVASVEVRETATAGSIWRRT